MFEHFHLQALNNLTQFSLPLYKTLEAPNEFSSGARTKFKDGPFQEYF